MLAPGHTAEELLLLREGTFKRVPDLVVWPETHDHCQAIVKAATKHNVVIIPFGGKPHSHLKCTLSCLSCLSAVALTSCRTAGGTTVTGAVMCPETETRMIVSLDTSKVYSTQLRFVTVN